MPNALTRPWKRRLVQAASLLLIGEFSYYGIFRCPFAVPYVSCSTCPVTQCPGRKLWLTAWVLILASALVFGKAFCGYACPGGMVSELLSRFALFKNKVRGRLASFLGLGRYAVLAVALWFWLGAGNPRWAVPIRVGDFFEATSLTFAHAFPLWFVRTGVVVGALALSLAIPYFWCRFLCPTGALLEPLRKWSILGWRMTSSCTDCGACARACGLETRPGEANCTNCADCVRACPEDAIRLQSPLGVKQAAEAQH